ncbi:MAG TPA: hypothetical protein VN625_02510 [Desulfuromonadaceae bacterium]|nr:hypothetical protein [Desulfuromonadaceae bacterium]
MKVFWIMALISLADRIAVADPSWQQALAQMPLARPAIELNHSNCVTLLLDSFQSNAVVKALVFMPGATDEIDFFRRARAHLTNSNPSLLNAITALTNQTYVQVRFETPLLILYTVEDPTNVVATIKSTSTAGKLHRQVIPRRIELRDADWGDVHDALDKDVSIGLSPRGNSPDSWHFYRHNFAGCGLTQWELLETLALAGKTTFTVHWLSASFEPDRRQSAPPTLSQFPR